MFYFVDRKNYLRAPKPVREHFGEHHDQWRFDGLSNVFFLIVILVAVFIQNPPFLRETLMIAAAAGSYFTTKKSVHDSNHFNFHPIQEVAILFIGIFATMMPALDWLQNNAQIILGKTPPPGFFYWGSGTLSSVLDNAPTYLSFLSAIFGSFINHETISHVQQLVQNGGAELSSAEEPVRHTFEALQKYFGTHLTAKTVSAEQIEIAYLLGNAQLNNFIVAISIGAVFFGANTYIGNGPNFMVKSIADQQKVHSPHFLEYIYKWTLPIMVPMLVIVWWIFFRH
jgi:Na+/H+ antiporter NhaD/arsenite permease-like protein